MADALGGMMCDEWKGLSVCKGWVGWLMGNGVMMSVVWCGVIGERLE